MAMLPSLTKTLSITSGKGGVGKTSITCNLAYNLAERGNRVLVLDGDFGLANAEILFGTTPRGNILEVIQGEKELSEIITTVLPGVDLISGGRGLTEFNRLTSFERKGLVDSISFYEYQYDYLLIDTAPGISDNVLYLNSAAQEIMVVITPDAASLADGYALIKVLNKEFKEKQFNIVCNMVRDEADGFALFQRFSEVAQRFLSLSLDYWGAIPVNPIIKKSSIQSRLALKHDQCEEIRQTFGQISSQMNAKLAPGLGKSNKAGLQFFWEQVVGVA